MPDDPKPPMLEQPLSDEEFRGFTLQLFVYLIKIATPEQVSFFMQQATLVRRELIAKDLEFKQRVLAQLALSGKFDVVDLAKMAALTPEQLYDKLTGGDAPTNVVDFAKTGGIVPKEPA